MLFKNTASQKIHVYAYDSTTGAAKTGDAANITGYVSLDGTANAIDDTNPTEVDATNMPGVYAFDLTQAETNCNAFALYAKSATANIRLEPIIGFTTPTNLKSAIDNYSATRGLAGTALPNAAADAAGGLPISDAGGLDLDTQLGKLVGTLASGTHNPQSGDAYSRIGATGSGLTSLASNADMATLLGRLTATRAGYLDNLNTGGTVASQSDINALNQSASRRVILTTVGQYERPDTGTVGYTIEARTYDGDGAAVDADSTPTLTATGSVSGSLAANLGSATNPATGVYRWTYTVDDAAGLEQIRFDLSAVIGSATFPMSVYTQTTDAVKADFTTSDRSNLEAIVNKLPSRDYLAGTDQSTGAIDASDKMGYELVSAYDAAKTAASQTSVDDIPTNAEFAAAFPANFAALGIDVTGAIEHVILVDTTTENTDMRGTDGAATQASADADHDATQAAVAALNNLAAGAAMTLTSGERTAIADAILDLANGIETGKTPRQALRLMAAALAGKRTNAGTSTEQYDAIGNVGTARIVIDADEDGNGTPVLTP
jgi:hypothetical protein